MGTGALGPEPPPAAFGRRAVALLVDIALYVAFAIGAFIAAESITGGRLFPFSVMSKYVAWQFWNYFAFAAIFVVLPIAITALLQSRWAFATLGKQLAGIRICALDGADPSFAQALARAACAGGYVALVLLPGPLFAALHPIPARYDTATGSLILLGLGFAFIFFAHIAALGNPRGLALHDWMSGTMVVGRRTGVS